MDNKTITDLIDECYFSYMDIHFARLMEKLSGKDDKLFLAAALASSQAGRGHICFDIAKTKKIKVAETELELPESNEWAEYLKNCDVVGKPGDFTPLVFEDERRLYLYRYWAYQKRLSDYILQQANQESFFSDNALDILKKGLSRLFPGPAADDEPDWQKTAACISVIKRFSVISGGPGTGKTTTITKVLALLAEQWAASKNEDRIRIYITAPTGKAAARLKESISNTKGTLDCSDHIRSMIPDDASTLHRLLGPIKNSPYFRYNEKRKLPADVVVVDEASMVDLALMSKFVQALPEDVHLIILGDQDQLASVAAGAVLGDICNTGEDINYSDGLGRNLLNLAGIRINSGEQGSAKGPLGDCITVLKKSYRFDDNSGIKQVSAAVNAGNDDLFYNILAGKRYNDIFLSELNSRAELEERLKYYVKEFLLPVFNEKDIRQRLIRFEKFRILCAVRKGQAGVEKLNIMIERLLQSEGVIQKDGDWYPGRPVMITRNDYQVGLYNGDIGITTRSEEDGSLEVCFMDTDGEIRRVRKQSLPDSETVYAMTIHKSQGSEFDTVMMIMPDRDVPVLTRELIYTGITRAKKFVEIRGREAIIRQGIQRRTERMTGLRQALWNNSL